jgi:hypothetical protein
MSFRSFVKCYLDDTWGRQVPVTVLLWRTTPRITASPRRIGEPPLSRASSGLPTAIPSANLDRDTMSERSTGDNSSAFRNEQWVRNAVAEADREKVADTATNRDKFLRDLRHAKVLFEVNERADDPGEKGVKGVKGDDFRWFAKRAYSLGRNKALELLKLNYDPDKYLRWMDEQAEGFAARYKEFDYNWRRVFRHFYPKDPDIEDATEDEQEDEPATDDPGLAGDVPELTLENAQSTIDEIADELTRVRAQRDAAWETIRRLEDELSKRPPRDPTPEDQWQQDTDNLLDRVLRPIDTPDQEPPTPTELPDARLRARQIGENPAPDADDPPCDGQPVDPPVAGKPDDLSKDIDATLLKRLRAQTGPTETPVHETPIVKPLDDPPTARDFKRLLNMGWEIAEIAEKYGISPAEVERSIIDNPPRIDTPPIDPAAGVAKPIDEPPAPKPRRRGRPRTKPVPTGPERLTNEWLIAETQRWRSAPGCFAAHASSSRRTALRSRR